MSLHHDFAVCVEARRGCQILWNWSCRWMLAIVWVLGTQLGSPGRQPVLLTYSWLSCPERAISWTTTKSVTIYIYFRLNCFILSLWKADLMLVCSFFFSILISLLDESFVIINHFLLLQATTTVRRKKYMILPYFSQKEGKKYMQLWNPVAH